MNKLILLAMLYLGSISYAQEVVYDSVWTFKLKVYNPTEQSLNLIIQNKIPENGELPVKFVELAPKDTTEFPFILSTAMDRVPENDFSMKIYEAPSYAHIGYHYYWNCKRIVDDNYSCLNVINENITIEDSLKFDKEDYLRELIENAPIYDDYSVSPLAKYDGELSELIKGARKIILKDKANTDVKMNVRFVVELDGSVSNVEFIKPSTVKYNNAMTAYFEKQKFVPGYRYGVKVRSKFTLPLNVEYSKN